MFATLEAKVLGSVALIAILLGAFGVYTFHERALGKAAELAALKKSSDELQKQTAAETADLKARATMAEQSYDKEHAALANLPPVQPVRLCLNANSGSVVPGASGKKPGDAATGATAGNLQPMPSGNNSSGQVTAGPDIENLLGLLAVRADHVSATLREYQSR